MFKRRHWYALWYGKYGIGYGAFAKMMQERGVDIDPTALINPPHA